MTTHVIETPALTWVVCPDGSRIRAEDVRGVYVVASFTERPWHVRLAVTHLPHGKPEERGNYTYSQHDSQEEAQMQAGMVMHSAHLTAARKCAGMFETCNGETANEPAPTKPESPNSTKDPFSSPVPNPQSPAHFSGNGICPRCKMPSRGSCVCPYCGTPVAVDVQG